MTKDLYKFKLVSYGKAEGLREAKRFLPKGSIGKNIEQKLDKEAEFFNRVAHEVWIFESNDMYDSDTDNLLEEWK